MLSHIIIIDQRFKKYFNYKNKKKIQDLKTKFLINNYYGMAQD